MQGCELMPRRPEPITDMSCKYGAPMGRRDDLKELYDVAQPDSIKVHLQHVPFVDGCYDQGGAYWGYPANLYAAWAYCEIEDLAESDADMYGCRYDGFVRADNHADAKKQLAAMYPGIRFYR